MALPSSAGLLGATQDAPLAAWGGGDGVPDRDEALRHPDRAVAVARDPARSSRAPTSIVQVMGFSACSLDLKI